MSFLPRFLDFYRSTYLRDVTANIYTIKKSTYVEINNNYTIPSEGHLWTFVCHWLLAYLIISTGMYCTVFENKICEQNTLNVCIAILPFSFAVISLSFSSILLHHSPVALFFVLFITSLFSLHFETVSIHNRLSFFHCISQIHVPSPWPLSLHLSLFFDVTFSSPCPLSVTISYTFSVIFPLLSPTHPQLLTDQ